MNAQLHPAWFEHEPGTIPTQVQFTDSVGTLSGKIRAIGGILQSIDEAGGTEELPEDTLGRLGRDLEDLAKEADVLAGSLPTDMKPEIERLKRVEAEAMAERAAEEMRS